MCIIAYKPAGVNPIKKRTYKECWRVNSDGAGFAYWDFKKQVWCVEKGFMSWKSFWSAFNTHQFEKKDIVAVHFRIGTSGNKDGGNTHPFDLNQRDFDGMRITKYETDKVLFHNGVIRHTGEGIASDTMVWVRDYVAPLINLALEDEKVMRIMEETMRTTANRWLLLTKNKVLQFGTWHLDFGGAKFSNKSYVILPPQKTTTHTTTTRTGGGLNTSVPVGSTRDNRTMSGWNTDKEKESDRINKALAAASKGKGSYIDANGSLITNSGQSFHGLTAVFALFDTETHNLRFRVESNSTIENLSCPNCFDDTMIQDGKVAGHEYSDSVCCSCGAVFDDHTGKIYLIDSRLVAKKNESLFNSRNRIM